MGDVLQYFGFPASIALVFGAVLGAFAVVERLASPTKKADLTSFLRSTDWGVWSSRMPTIVRESFNIVFGPSHFSAKCVRRSIVVSLSAIFVLLILGFINNFHYFKTMPQQLTKSQPSFRIIFFGWLSWSIFIDFVNLLKTRTIIAVIQRYHLNLIISSFVVLFDVLLTFLVFSCSYEYLDSLNMANQICAGKCTASNFLSLSFAVFRTVIRQHEVWIKQIAAIAWGPVDNELAIFFYAGLLPTLWLLVYVMATATTRLITRASDQISFTFRLLDIDQHPIQSIGIVAAFLVSAVMIIYNIAAKIL